MTASTLDLPTAAETREVASMERRTKVFNRVCTTILIVFAALWLIPILWALDTAIKPNGETTVPTWLIKSPTLASFGSLFQQGDILNWYASSFITSVLTTALTVLTASMAGYALSRLRFRGRYVVLLVILVGLMIPPQALVVPQFRLFDGMHLLNTYWAVILPQVPAVIAVLIFKQFFDNLPKELEEAARVDGAGFWRIYSTVLMPLARPAVSAVAIFTFVATWNNLLWPLLAVTNPDIMTIPVGLATVQGSYGIRYADIMASAILGALPLIIVFLLFQRRIVEGIANTGLKG